MSGRGTGARARYDYTQGSIRRGMLRLSIPVFFELLAWNIDSILELFWVGQLGAPALAAMSLGFMVLAFVRAPGMANRTAGQALLAQRIGAGDTEGASRLAGQMIVLQLILFTPIIAAGIAGAPVFMAMISADPEIIHLGTIYLRAGFSMLFFIDGIFTLAAIFRGSGEPGFSLTGMIVNSISGFVAMPLLVFGAGPIPALGIAGAPLGLGVGRLAGSAVMLGFLFSGRCRIHLSLSDLLPRAHLLLRIAELGWPIGGQNFFERGANLVLISILSPFGGVALAAWGIGNQVSHMGRMTAFALQSAVRTMVGQNIGGQRPERARRAAWATIGAVFIILSCTTSAIFLWAPEIIRFFGMSGEAKPAGIACLRILCLGIVFEGTRRVISGIFEGAAQTKPPMFVEALIRWPVMLPMAYGTSVWLGLRESGIWWAVAGSQVLGGLALFFWFKFGWERRIRES